jgi:nitroreductase
MNVKEAVVTRRNVREFKPEPLDRMQLISWMESARYAPNHGLTEPWNFLFVGPQTRPRLNHRTDYGGAPHVIAVLSKAGSSQLERDENMMATACFMQNFMLIAHEAGVGTRWSSVGNTQQGREALGVADDYIVVGTFGIGYPLIVPSVRERSPIQGKIKDLP